MSKSRVSDSLDLKPTTALLLKNLNNQFLAQHQKTARTALAPVESVIVFNGNLSLYLKDEKTQNFTKKEEVVVAPDEGLYTQIKQISHIPLLVLEVLESDLSTVVKKEALNKIANDIAIINDELIGPSQDIKIQKKILELTKIFLSIMIKVIYIDPKEMIEAYMAELKSALEYNRQRATDIQINQLKAFVENWIAVYKLNMVNARILMVGPHGPRKGLIEMQYFLDLYTKLGFPEAEDSKIYYVEQLPQHFGHIKIESDLIENFLAVCERNKKIGKAFKNDETFMFKDILADCAPDVLSNCPPAVLANLLKLSKFHHPSVSASAAASACPVMKKLMHS